jgi:hypothetical protein
MVADGLGGGTICGMSTAPTLNYATPTRGVRQVRLMIAALVMLVYPISVLSERYIIRPWLWRRPYMRHFGWGQYLPLALAVVSTVGIVVGIWLLTAARNLPGERSARLRYGARVAAGICLLFLLGRIVFNYSTNDYNELQTYTCVVSSISGGTYALAYVLTAIWMARLGSQQLPRWAGVSSICVMTYSALANVVLIFYSVAFVLLVPPVPQNGLPGEALEALLRPHPPLVRLLSAANDFATPTHLIAQSGLWITVAIWAGRRRPAFQ